MSNIDLQVPLGCTSRVRQVRWRRVCKILSASG